MLVDRSAGSNCMKPPRKPPWKQPKPPGAKRPAVLTARQREAARQRADAAGRRYPNLVDNMWAARQPK